MFGESLLGKLFSTAQKIVYLWALVKIQNMDEAKHRVIKFLRKAGHSYDEIAQQVGYTKSTTQRICNLCKSWEQAGQKSFLSQKNQRIVAGFVKKFVCQF